MMVAKQGALVTHHSPQRAVCLDGALARRRLLQGVYGLVLLLMLVASAATLSQAQQGPALTQPVQLCPQNGVLSASLQVQLTPYVLPGTTQPVQLRTYNLVPGGTWQYCSGTGSIQNPMIPGPTFRLRKGAQGQNNGNQVSLTLTNLLPASDGSDHTCNPARDYTATNVHPGPSGVCSQEDFPLVQQQWPACLHGDNVTNIHYHGSHVSPQPHQDFVLLSLYPQGSTHVTPSTTDAIGTYQYTLDPLLYTQAEGTHWYHPHKHGSTALQVTNGMAGAILIAGPFDDWLNGLYTSVGGLTEQVLVVQQLSDKTNFFSDNPPPSITTQGTNCQQNPSQCTCQANITFSAATPSVNGQFNPVITMRPGEIQRWRFINAEVQLSGGLKIGFSPEFQVKQIAQDGVQFSQQNYQQQPLLSQAWFVPGQPTQLLTNINLAPGNRADYLVKAPTVKQRTCYSHVQATFGNVADPVRKTIDARNQAARQASGLRAQAQAGPAPFLTVCVDPSLGPKPMAFPNPTQWFPLPYFLQNIPPQPTQTTVAFSMEGSSTGTPTNNFFIDGVQYCPDCANKTMTLNAAQEWIITNDSPPQHPFHIHTNPHQLVEQGSMLNGQPVPFKTYTSPVWEDTIALPAVTKASNQQGCWNLPAGPIASNTAAQTQCPKVCTAQKTTWNGNWVTTVPGQMSVCQCCPPDGTPGYVRIRQLPIDFTGEFVLHCHILGHEDRGMMQNVQVVCPQGLYFGNPLPGGQPECVSGNFIPAAQQCPVTYKTGPQCAASPGS